MRQKIGYINRYRVYPYATNRYNIWDHLRGKWVYLDRSFNESVALAVCRDLLTTTNKRYTVWFEHAKYPKYDTSSSKNDA